MRSRNMHACPQWCKTIHNRFRQSREKFAWTVVQQKLAAQRAPVCFKVNQPLQICRQSRKIGTTKNSLENFPRASSRRYIKTIIWATTVTFATLWNADILSFMMWCSYIMRKKACPKWRWTESPLVNARKFLNLNYLFCVRPQFFRYTFCELIDSIFLKTLCVIMHSTAW